MGLLILLLGALVLGVAAYGLWLLLARRGRNAAGSGPRCGGCGYQLAPNPAGLTLCPECGGNFLHVGIVAPGMKLARTTSPAVPLGIAWLLLVGVGSIPLYHAIERATLRNLTTTTTTTTSSGQGALSSIALVTTTVQLQGAPAPDKREIDVTITDRAGNRGTFTLDATTDTVVRTSAALRPLAGQPWNQIAASRAIQLLTGAQEPDPQAAERLTSDLDAARTTPALFNALGGVRTTSTSSTSSSSVGRLSSGRSPTTGFSVFSTTSNTTGNTVRIPVIGSLRGYQWVIAITAASALVLALGGLWLIVLMCRTPRRV